MPVTASLQASFGYGRPQSTPPVTANLQVYLTPQSYAGSGTTWDNLQNTTEATLVNAPTFNAQQGFTLNGTNQCMTLPDVTGVTDFTQAYNYTIEGWVYINSTQNDTATGDNDIIEKWDSDGSSSYPYVMRFIRGSTLIVIGAFNGSANPTISMSITTNRWNQILAVFDHTNKLLKGYINGTSITSSALNITGIANNSTLNIGRRANNTGGGYNFLTGRIGIVRIYSAALTDAQIAQNFAADRRRFGI